MTVPGPHDVIIDVINDVIISDGQNQYLNCHFPLFLIFSITKPEQKSDVTSDVIIAR